MLPVSRNDLFALTPEGDEGPTYYLAPATSYGRILFDREVISLGATGATEEAITSTLRDAAERLLEGPERARMLEAIHLVREDPPGDVDRAASDEYRSAVALLTDFGERAVREWPPYAEKCAATSYRWDTMRVVAATMFLRRWEGVDGDLRMENGTVSNESLSLIPHEHLLAIGERAIEFMFLSPAQKKS